MRHYHLLELFAKPFLWSCCVGLDPRAVTDSFEQGSLSLDVLIELNINRKKKKKQKRNQQAKGRITITNGIEEIKLTWVHLLYLLERQHEAGDPDIVWPYQKHYQTPSQ